MWTVWVNMRQAKRLFDASIARLAEALERADTAPSKVIVCITGKNNFRRDVLPTYKGHRKRKPPGYREFQDWILDESGYTTFLRDGLEADDCLGILATSQTQIPGRKVLWSKDKDLKQIPTEHLDADARKLVTVNERDGEMLHVKQTLTGDVTDGYTGLVGFGDVAAKKFLEKHKDSPLGAVWQAVEEEYTKKGKTREDMLQQARVARISRAQDYDFQNKTVKLWTP